NVPHASIQSNPFEPQCLMMLCPQSGSSLRAQLWLLVVGLSQRTDSRERTVSRGLRPQHQGTAVTQRFDVRELLAVYPRCALVGAALRIGMGQNVFTADLVVQGVEAVVGFCLRFRVQRRLQFLNTLRS